MFSIWKAVLLYIICEIFLLEGAEALQWEGFSSSSLSLPAVQSSWDFFF